MGRNINTGVLIRSRGIGLRSLTLMGEIGCKGRASEGGRSTIRTGSGPGHEIQQEHNDGGYAEMRRRGAGKLPACLLGGLVPISAAISPGTRA